MYQRILVPIDASAISMRGLDEAIALARLTGGRLRLLHVVNDVKYPTGPSAVHNVDLVPLMRETGEGVLTEGKDRATRANLEVETLRCVAMTTRVSDLVVQDVRDWDADLIVMGTHGRRGLGRLFVGSDAERVLRISPVPVLLVRSDATHDAHGRNGARHDASPSSAARSRVATGA